MRVLRLLLAFILIGADAHAQILPGRIGRAAAPVEGGGTPVSITSIIAPLASGTEGVTYTSGVINCTGGTGAGFTLHSSGTLPAGLTVNSSARTITGTPTIATSVGTANFSLECRDNGMGVSGFLPASITIGFGTPDITTSSLTGGTIDVAGCGNNTLAAQGGQAPRTFSIVSGSLPAGCTLTGSTGAIAGTPTASGTFIVDYRVTDNLGSQSAIKQLSLTIAPGVTGACNGPNTNDYFLCLSGLGSGGISVAPYAMRSVADVNAQDGSGNGLNTTDGFAYVFSTDTEDGKIDATKITQPPTLNSTVRVPNFTINRSTGDIYITWDEEIKKSYRVGRGVCAGNGEEFGEKSHHIRGQSYAGANTAATTFEIRENFAGNQQVSAYGTQPSGTVPGFDPPTAIPVTTLTASGVTATATTSGAHQLTNGQTVVVAGASNSMTIAVSGCTQSATPVCTTVAPHGLTNGQQFDTRYSGESPNVFGSAPADHFTATVTGASTVTLARNTVIPISMSSATTGGTFTIYPYSRRFVAATVTDSTHFTYPLICSAADCGGTTFPTTATISSTGAWVIPFDAQGDMDEAKLRGGNDCGTVDMRRYTVTGPHSLTAYAGDHTTGQQANWILKCGTRTRFHVVIQLNQGTGWTCGADSSYSGTYDRIILFVSDENTAGALVFDFNNVELDRLNGLNPATMLRESVISIVGGGECATHTSLINGRDNPQQSGTPQAGYVGKLVSTDWERNSSGGGCNLGFGARGIAYMWNEVIAYGAAGLITANTVTPSINLNGTEVLIQPVAP